MKFIAIIYFIIRVHYPNNNIDDIRFYNDAINEAFSSYCFLGIEFDYTLDKNSCADIEIYPYFDLTGFPGYLGMTYGTVLQNPKLYGTPSVLINKHVAREHFKYIIKHEIFHVLGGQYHSIDPNSLMYPYFNEDNKYLTRHDSLYLLQLYKR